MSLLPTRGNCTRCGVYAEYADLATKICKECQEENLTDKDDGFFLKSEIATFDIKPIDSYLTLTVRNSEGSVVITRDGKIKIDGEETTDTELIGKRMLEFAESYAKDINEHGWFR